MPGAEERYPQQGREDVDGAEVQVVGVQCSDTVGEVPVFQLGDGLGGELDEVAAAAVGIGLDRCVLVEVQFGEIVLGPQVMQRLEVEVAGLGQVSGLHVWFDLYFRG